VRREAPRIPALGAFCTEITEERERYSIVSDVSAKGLRLHRPYAGIKRETVQLEFDLPGIDELIWAKGAVRFDAVWRTADGHLVHTSGIQLARAAAKHLRLLRDYAYDCAPGHSHYAERRATAR
jgi:hypothetical protein